MTGGSNTRHKPAGVRGHADVCLRGEAKISQLRSKKKHNRFRLVAVFLRVT